MVQGSSQYSICPECHAGVPELHPSLLHWRKCPVCAYCYDERDFINAAQEGQKPKDCRDQHRNPHGRGIQPSPSDSNRSQSSRAIKEKEQKEKEVMDHHRGPKKLKDSQMICDECGIVSYVHASGICSDCRKQPCHWCGKSTTSKLKEPTCRDCQVLSPAKRLERLAKTSQRRR